MAVDSAYETACQMRVGRHTAAQHSGVDDFHAAERGDCGCGGRGDVAAVPERVDRSCRNHLRCWPHLRGHPPPHRPIVCQCRGARICAHRSDGAHLHARRQEYLRPAIAQSCPGATSYRLMPTRTCAGRHGSSSWTEQLQSNCGFTYVKSCMASRAEGRTGGWTGQWRARQNYSPLQSECRSGAQNHPKKSQGDHNAQNYRLTSNRRLRKPCSRAIHCSIQQRKKFDHRSAHTQTHAHIHTRMTRHPCTFGDISLDQSKKESALNYSPHLVDSDVKS